MTEQQVEEKKQFFLQLFEQMPKEEPVCEETVEDNDEDDLDLMCCLIQIEL